MASKTAAPADLSNDQTIELAEMFKLLGDPTRLKIVIECLSGPLPVGAIAETLGLSPSLVSHHLRLLRATRLVRSDRQGRQMLYVIHDTHIEQVIADMTAHIQESHE